MAGREAAGLAGGEPAGVRPVRARELAVEGAVEFCPQVFTDDRGLFVSPFQSAVVREAGCPVFPVAQISHSGSRRGVVRGAHFTLAPPGAAKYVHCVRGTALDVLVDIRANSPTFGRTATVLLDQTAFRAVYVPVGVAHAFVALEDDTLMSYLLSAAYVREHELAVSVFDPAIEVPIPADIDPVMSERDRAAPGLAEIEAAGTLPDYAECRRIERALRSSGEAARGGGTG